MWADEEAEKRRREEEEEARRRKEEEVRRAVESGVDGVGGLERPGRAVLGGVGRGRGERGW